jgi:hypothetical protein
VSRVVAHVADLDPHGALDRIAIGVEAAGKLELHRRTLAARVVGVDAWTERSDDADGNDGTLGANVAPRGQGRSSPPNRRTAWMRRP